MGMVSDEITHVKVDAVLVQKLQRTTSTGRCVRGQISDNTPHLGDQQTADSECVQCSASIFSFQLLF